MPKKQDWSPRHPTRAIVRLELTLGLGEDADTEATAIDLAALKESFEAFVQHGTFLEALEDALSGSGQPLDAVSWTIRVKGA